MPYHIAPRNVHGEPVWCYVVRLEAGPVACGVPTHPRKLRVGGSPPVGATHPRGQAATFLIHVEAQAKHHNGFPQRMFRYFVLLSAKHDEPVYPIAVLTYAKPKVKAEDTYMITLAERNVIRFQFQVVQLNRCNWEEFRERENPAAAALMTQMNIAPADRPLVKQLCYEIIQKLRLLSKRFGPLPETTRQALSTQPAERLEALADDIFDLQSLDALHAQLQA